MKKGKSITLKGYQPFKVSYGSVDVTNLKSIYINLQTWVEPKHEIPKINYVVNNLSRSIKHTILDNINNDIFQKNFILDLDLRTSGIQLNKKSFMNLECYLYTNSHIDFKSLKIKNSIKIIAESIISENLITNTNFSFSSTKNYLSMNYI